jgi:hypothetical protein
MKATISGILLALALVVVGPLQGQAQDAPTEVQVAEGLRFEIPAIWEVEALTIQATQNVGSIIDPDIRMRIRATARLQQETFGFVAQIDNVTVLAPVLPEGHLVELFGFASARLYRGEWEYSFDFQGSAFEGSGAPRSSFSGRTVLRDSEEHRAVIAEAEARQRAAIEAQQAAIAQATAQWRDLLQRGEFRGQSSDGRTVWPFEVVDVVLDANDRFTGQLTWTTLSSVQRINGIITDGVMIFQNVENIQRGEAILNCVYQLALEGDAMASGRYSRCAQGNVRVTFETAEIINQRNSERSAALEALREAVTGTWISEEPLRNNNGYARGSGSNLIYYQIDIPAGAELRGQARVTVFTSPDISNRAHVLAPFSIVDSELHWTDGNIQLWSDARGSTPWVWSTTDVRWVGQLVDDKLHIAMQGSSHSGAGWTAVLSRR